MRKLLFIALLLMFQLLVLAQAPNQINYQGIARNASGNPIVNQNIAVRLKVHDISASGTVIYSETRNLSTNASGLFTIVIGSSGATNVSGIIAGINWSTGNKYLEVDIDPAGGTAFTSIGTSQLNSVPYAINAKQADALSSNATINPNQINSSGASNGQVLKWNGTAWAPGTDIQASGGATYSAGSGITINGSNVISNSGDLSNTNELQTLSVSGNQLTIANGNSVTLPTGTTYTAGTGVSISANTISNTGDLSNTNELQTLSKSGNTITLSNSGGSVTDNDAQTLSVSGNQLTIANGNSVTLPTGTTYTAGTGVSISANTISNTGDLSNTNELQTISKSGNTITLSNSGGSVTDNDAQTLSVSGNQLTIANGNSVTLPTGTTYTAGSGINIVGNIIQNIGDVDPLNDLTDETVAGGDLSGLLYAPTVTRIHGRPIVNISPTNGQVLVWNSSAWTPGTLPNPTSTCWSLTGNPLLNVSDYLGTSGNFPVVFKSNNLEMLRLTGATSILAMKGQLNILKDYRQLDLQTPTVNEYSRMSFTNAITTTRYWDVVAKIDNTGVNNDDFAIWNSSTGPALQFTGDRKVKFFNALMPNNNAGTSGQVLASAGSSAAPTWVSSTNSLYNNTYLYEQNATINLTGNSFTSMIPGLSGLTFTTTGSAKVLIDFSHGSIFNTNNVAGGDMDVAFTIYLKQGTTNIKTTNYYLTVHNGKYASISGGLNMLLPSAGTYTVDIEVFKTGDDGVMTHSQFAYGYGQTSIQVIPQ